jgi:hypothetical protein
MNQDLLLETIEIITRHMLYDPKFGGSTEGRRLTEIRWQLLGQPQRKPVTSQPRTGELVSRTVSLPINLDNALSVAVENSGVSRSDLIAEAVAILIAELP